MNKKSIGKALIFYNCFFGMILSIYGQSGVALPAEIQAEYLKLHTPLTYNQDIKPILSDKCFPCHGNDANKRKAGLRLDIAASAHGPLPNDPTKYAIRSKNVVGSELYQRILSNDADYLMPSPASHLELSPKEKALLIKWIEDGAEYQPHWAFVPPTKSKIPEVKNNYWTINPIDNFVLSRLEKENLHPSAPSAKEILMRRLSFDLTGLPPSIEELDHFIMDQNPDSYHNQVDRLLASPHFGERMAVDWLDLARFADSHGYTVDRLRDMSPYRDWVIKAFNQNLPYSSFIQYQLAGDLIPHATKEMKIATAFNRNHPQNAEGGIIEKEFQTEYVIDRTNTFGQTFIGLSVGCARCHDHKFDPISQKNYYELFSYFNNVHEAGQISWNNEMPTPTLLLPTTEQEKILEYINKSIDQQEKTLNNTIDSETQNIKSWLHRDGYSDLSDEFIPQAGLKAYYTFKDSLIDIIHPYQSGKMRRETDTAAEIPNIVSMGKGHVLALDGDGFFDTKIHGIYRMSEPFTISIKLNIPKELKDGVLLHKCIAERLYNFKGYYLALKDDHLELCMAHTAPSNAITKISLQIVPKDQWIHLAISYDGSSKANGLKLYLDGNDLEMETTTDHLYKDIIFFEKQEPALQVGGWWRGLGFKGGKIDDLLIYDDVLSPYEIKILAGKATWSSICNKKHNQLTKDEKYILKEYYLAHRSMKVIEQKDILKKQRTLLADSSEHIPEIMIMQEMAQPRQSYILHRGNYDSPGKEVYPNTPASILPLNKSLPKNRYGLAQWLVDKKNPLTARVEVNRIWQMLFGNGLVKTAEDFGNQGQLPSHPELLDWLSIQFIQSDWDIKKLIKMIVLSATYQQDSKSTPSLLEQDPQNKLLARGPGIRLSAEMLRDQALCASGLMNKKIGGKSFKPYQPQGLWEINSMNYVPDSTDQVYRRSLYILIKRSVPNPTLATFDAPDRSYCLARRQNTNTPLQSLTLLNDPCYLEASKVLGEQMALINDPLKSIIDTYRKVTARTPNEKELSLLQQIREDAYASFKANPANARGWLNAGIYKINSNLDSIAIASYAVVASTILNSDASISKR